MLRLVSIWFLFGLPAAAQLDSALTPRELDRGEGEGLPFESFQLPEAEDADRSPVMMKSLHTLVLEGDGPNPGAAAGAVRGLVLRGLSPEVEVPLTAALSPWLGRPLTENGLDRLTDIILAVYGRNDRPVIDIAVPDQDLVDGRLVVEITEGRVGAVGMTRTAQFNDELLGGAIHLEEGELLTASGLQEQLDWLNRNPFRPASVFAAPGAGIGEADFVFTFDEVRTWRVYTGYENSGTKAAGEHRFLAGANWGNAFGLDQLLSYQVTVGDSIDQFHAHSLAWEIPVHEWHRFIRIEATWADVEARSVIDGMPVNASGETWAVALGFGIPLPRHGDFTHEIVIGADFKATDNFLTFGDLVFPGETVEIVQARIDYEATARWADSALDAELSLVASPGGITPRNDDAAFEAFRAGAHSDYAYLRGKLTWVRRLPEAWSLRLAAEGQLASGRLLAIEQLAFGGHDAVRGFSEREYLADSGYLLSSEIRTPALGLVFTPLPVSQVQFLAFLDHGTGWRHGGGSESFTGAGAGLRLQAEDFGELRLDLAIPLGESGGPELHAGVLLAF